MGFDPCFLKNPVSQFSINNFSWEDFLLSRGIHQGCPLSFILFAISLEPLASAICNNSGIKGMTIGFQSQKLSLFADDTVVYFTNPIPSLLLLIQNFNLFDAETRFTINYNKSEFYPIALPSSLKLQIQSHFSFCWVSTSWCHLCIDSPWFALFVFGKLRPSSIQNSQNDSGLGIQNAILDRVIELVKCIILPQFSFSSHYL